MSKTCDDEDLATQAAAGDGAAFHSLLQRHYDRVFRVVYSVVRDQSDAEDITQEVWAALPSKLRRWTSWAFRAGPFTVGMIDTSHMARMASSTVPRIQVESGRGYRVPSAGRSSILPWSARSYCRVNSQCGLPIRKAILARKARYTGSSYISGKLAKYINDKEMSHVRGAPYHPQT